jgi:heme o synthase
MNSGTAASRTGEYLAPGAVRPPGSMEMTTGTQRAGMAALHYGGGSSRVRQQLRDYVTLTKPRIISLLLVTTVTPMAVAAGGWPGGWLILWVLAGGYLMAGGANALNMYLDRDIDARMGRTSLRPIPSGRMSPRHVLAFGISLAAGALAIFLLCVNPLSAGLALAGLVFYVFIYTLWLKRSTPQNIVLGGGAGAFPPLVGWAAVTGDLALTAWVFFLIVCLWTPPHFWALALVKQKDYGTVGVPMAPNVWGERRTVAQMIGYTVALVLLTLVPVAIGSLGLVYGWLALLLGAWFLRDVLRLRSSTARAEQAWAVYKTSLLYLALLFAAMGVDLLFTA